MKKKIILLSTTLIVIFAGLFLYQRFINVGPSVPSSGPESTTTPFPEIRKSDDKVDIVQMPQGVRVGRSENLDFVRLNKNGRWVLKVSYVERLPSLPGQLKFKLPCIQIRSKDERITEITAQTATVEDEGAEGQMQIPNNGFLENVRIRMYRLPMDMVIPIPLSDESALDRYVEIEVLLDQTVRFEREFARLQSAGDYTVRSKLFDAEGAELLLVYDQNNERLQELELKQLKQLRLSRMTMESQTKTAKSEPLEPETTETSSRSKTATYHFTLSKNVVGEQPAKREKILANRIDAFVDFDPDLYKSQEPNSPERNENRQALPVDSDKNPTDEKTSDIFLTCDGPLRISLAKDYEPTANADRMILVATGEPAQIFKDGKLALEANRIQHDQTNEVSEITGSIERPVRMSLSERQWATAQRKVVLDQKKNFGTLYGPGQIEYLAESNEEPAIIHYHDELLVKFTELPGSLTESADEKNTFVEWISFQGPFHAESKDGRVQADKYGKLVFFIPPTTSTPISGSAAKKNNKVGAGPIQYLELWGNVIARDQQSNFHVTDHLEADFEYIDPNTSRIRSLYAFGPVRAEDPNYILEAGDKLELTFNTKDPAEKSKPTREQAKIQETQSTWGFDQLLGSANLLHAVADGAQGTLQFTSKQDEYQIIGDRAVGGEPNQIWTITGLPARVVGLAGQGRLDGNKITADLINKICRIDGPGSMDVVMKGDLLGRDSSQPMPTLIDWKDGVNYNLKEGNVIAEKVNVRIESEEKTRQVTVLQCPAITIEFDPNSSPDRTNDLYARLDMNTFLAHGGQVQVRRREYNPNTNRLLNDLEMLTQNLHFDNRSRILLADGPGLIQVNNYRPRQPGKSPPQDQSVNLALTRMFGDSGPACTLLRFGREMRFDKDPNELRFTGGVALDHLPLTKDLKPNPALLARLPGMRKLDCDELILILTDTKSGPPISGKSKITKQTQSADLSGFQDSMGNLLRVTALGRVAGEANFDDGTRHFFSGEKLTYDSHSREIVIEGTDAVPAYLNQMQYRTVRFNLETGEIEEAIPLGQSILSGKF